jgi:multidrug/hemolysin transport system ATP-binding protein
MTIFLTTHYMEETAEADRVVILDKGHVIASGSPSELKSRHTSPKLVWYAEQNEARDGLLDGCVWTYEADHYNVYYADSVTDFLYRNREQITDYEVLKGTMDDVFLNLTGREMAV